MAEARKRRWVNIVLVLVVVGAIAALGGYYLSLGRDGSYPGIEEFVRGFGAWALPAYALLYVVGSPIPMLAPVLSAVGGLVFGAVWGTLATIVIATGSSLVPFFLARRLGQEWIAKRLKGKKLDQVYQKSAGENGFAFVLIMRLVPVLPWEIQNYVAGLSRVKIPTFIAATLIGIIPGTFALTFLGSSITNPRSLQFWLAIGLNIAIIGATMLVVRLRSRRRPPGPPESGQA